MSNPLEEAELIGRVLQAVQVELVGVVKRAKETTQAEADLATLKRENEALRERHARTAEQLQGVRSTMQVTIDALRERLAATEHERYQLQTNLSTREQQLRDQIRTIRQLERDLSDARGVNAAHVRRQQDPSLTEEALHDQVEKVRAYVKGLRIWGTEDKAQICTDILYIIGEN